MEEGLNRWTTISPILFGKDMIWNVEDRQVAFSLSITSRREISTRMMFTAKWIGEDGLEREVSGSNLGLCMERAAEAEIQKRGGRPVKAPTGLELIEQYRSSEIVSSGMENAKSMAEAAICYIKPTLIEDYWPWGDEAVIAPNGRIGALAMAGALIAAEIDRLTDITPHEDG